MKENQELTDTDYYTVPGTITEPGRYGFLFNDLPDDIPSLCSIVQGLILHMHWAERYGVRLSEKRLGEANLRRISRQLERIMEINDSLLTVRRALESKLVGNCRDFSTFLTAILRHKNVPARARCGFGTYFTKDSFEDHWVCQYWKAEEDRWVMVDAQLDQFQRDELGIEFNNLDMIEGLFLPAGEAWRMCRSGKADPGAFGIFDMHGLWFIRENLIRDLLSLNKIELLPWDTWGLISKYREDELPSQDMELLDYIADLTRGMNPDLAEVKGL